tara:strand:- start:654 stop:1232 length:579 start_codon:yes stop_codon:yes gene_type:complete
MNFESKNEIKKKAFEVLEDGVKNRDSLFHTLTLSTFDGEYIDSRVMVLREFNHKKRRLRFHTDARSKKIKDLDISQTSSVIGYDPAQKIQIRFKGILKSSYKNKETLEAWEKSQDISKKCYSVKDGSTSIIKTPASHDFHINDVILEEGYKNFSILHFYFNSLEFLYLQRSGHRRCKFDWSSGRLRSSWLVP